jgi:thiamine-phosphate pyrophosphorylase
MMTPDRDGESWADDIIQRVEASARTGITLIQIRERRLEGGALFQLVARAVGAVRGTPTRIVVNDRLDVALGAGAHGVHLRAGSMDARRVRDVAPAGFIVGRSVHDAAAAATATSGGGLDYLVFGTVFPSVSKAGREPAGVQTLRHVVAATPLPVLAVGGMGPDVAGYVAAAGAAGIAAISLFADARLDALGEIVRRTESAFVSGTND